MSNELKEWIMDLCPEIREWQADCIIEHIERVKESAVKAERDQWEPENTRLRAFINECIVLAMDLQTDTLLHKLDEFYSVSGTIGDLERSSRVSDDL